MKNKTYDDISKISQSLKDLSNYQIEFEGLYRKTQLSSALITLNDSKTILDLPTGCYDRLLTNIRTFLENELEVTIKFGRCEIDIQEDDVNVE